MAGAPKDANHRQDLPDYSNPCSSGQSRPLLSEKSLAKGCHFHTLVMHNTRKGCAACIDVRRMHPPDICQT